MPIARVDNLSDRFPACPRAPFARTLPDLELDIGIGDSEHLAAPIRLRGEGSRSLGSVGFIGRAMSPQNSGREQHSLIRVEISLIT
jgi:hypothetical protein